MLFCGCGNIISPLSLSLSLSLSHLVVLWYYDHIKFKSNYLDDLSFCGLVSLSIFFTIHHQPLFFIRVSSRLDSFHLEPMLVSPNPLEPVIQKTFLTNVLCFIKNLKPKGNLHFCLRFYFLNGINDFKL